jgi:C-terminal processing protease CtpA/Prc
LAIEQELTDSKVAMQVQGTKCRELIALSQRCISEDHLTEHEILTIADQNSTTMGVMIREKSDKVFIEYILVGSPAFNSKMVEKGDVIVAVDGKAINGDAMFMSALADRQGTSVTLSIKKQGENAPVDVELQSMPTNLIADKRKIFDLFDAIDRRFLKGRDTIGKQHVDDALALWTQMCMEEIDHDHKYVSQSQEMFS